MKRLCASFNWLFPAGIDFFCVQNLVCFCCFSRVVELAGYHPLTYRHVWFNSYYRCALALTPSSRPWPKGSELSIHSVPVSKINIQAGIVTLDWIGVSSLGLMLAVRFDESCVDVDVGPLVRKKGDEDFREDPEVRNVVHQLDLACRNVGFFYVVWNLINILVMVNCVPEYFKIRMHRPNFYTSMKTELEQL